MIVPAQKIRIVVAVKPVDFRRGHDGLVATAQNELGLDPHSGVVVVFRSRRSDRIKVLVWDGSTFIKAQTSMPTARAIAQVMARGFDALHASPVASPIRT